MKIFVTFLIGVFFCEVGILPLAIAAGVSGGAGLLGGLLGKKKKSEEVYDPYAAQRGSFMNYLGSKQGTSTPYSYNPAFETDQPDVESAAQSTILGKLGNPTDYGKNFKEISDNYYNAAKEKRAASAEEEVKSTQDMYNRLGLVSSTPGLEAVGKVREQQRLDENALATELANNNIANEMTAQQYGDQSALNWTNAADVLGNQQRGYQQTAIGMSQDDINRMTDEELSYAQMMASILGANPPQRTVSYTPDTWSKVGQVLGGNSEGIGSVLSLLGKMGMPGLK